jgi:protein-S-isoprenylcysteine O-methyltransferase Ste14
MAKRLYRLFLGLSIISAGVLALAGTWGDRWLWSYLGVWAVLGVYGMVILDDDLARERFHPPVPGADRLALRVVRLSALAHLIVGALDVGRWHIALVPSGLRAAALVGMAVTGALVFHAMHTNRFFSSVVRIQTDRGHRVVDNGPYALVRHPGYAGMIPMVPLSGLALGSWLAAAVGLLYSALVFKRVLFEDAYLRENLGGYVDYARRVRYRLVPGIW